MPNGKVTSVDIGTKWKSDIKYDDNRRKYNTTPKKKKK